MKRLRPVPASSARTVRRRVLAVALSALLTISGASGLTALAEEAPAAPSADPAAPSTEATGVDEGDAQPEQVPADTPVVAAASASEGDDGENVDSDGVGSGQQAAGDGAEDVSGTYAVSDGMLVWGIDDNYRDIFSSRSKVDPAYWSADDEAVFPVEEGNEYDATTGTGSIQFEGSVTLGYGSGVNGIYLTVVNPKVTIDAGGTGEITAERLSSASHGLDERFPFNDNQPNVTLAKVQFGQASQTLTTEGVKWEDVPVTLTSAGLSYLPWFASASMDEALQLRTVGSALANLDLELAFGGKTMAPPPGGGSSDQGGDDAGDGTTDESKIVTDGKTVTSSNSSKTKGALSWGVKAAFRSYITGNIAQGQISLSNGTKYSGGRFRFTQSSAGAWSSETKKGKATYRGTVHFTGHHGVLNVRLSNPAVTVNGNTGSLSVSYNGSRLTIANLSLPTGVEKGGAVTFTNAKATLTSAGASRVFEGYYSTGTALDPVTFTIGRAGSSSGGTVTVASATTKSDLDIPTTPPATTGLTVDTDEVQPGDPITGTASGFEPDETGIAVVLYSEPTVLTRMLTADASGNITWKGLIPESTPAGEHTLTVQGASHAVGATLTVTEGEDDANMCEVSDGQLTWGVKESFRSYISGSIARGEWTTSDGADYETPNFLWKNGTGDFNPTDSAGEIEFEGGIRFTGHDGVLDMHLNDPTVKFVDAQTAYLVLDVDSKQTDGSTVEADDVTFAQLDLSAAKTADGVVSYEDVPLVLTAEGAEAFAGYYQEGVELDPLTISFALPSDCAVAAAQDEATPLATATPSASAAADQTADASAVPPWIWALVGGLVVIILALAAIIVAGRRQKPTDA